MIRETVNNVYIVGKLKKKNLELKEIKGMQVITGNLIIVCDTKMGKSEVSVRVYQNKYTKKGEENTLYKGLMTVNSEFIDSTQSESPDTIKVTGRLDDNFYFINGDTLVEKPEIYGIFFSRVEPSTEHCCKLEFEGFISEIDNTEKGLEVKLIGLGNAGLAFPLKAEMAKELIEPFITRYMTGCVATLNIAILNTVRTETVNNDGGFGESIGEVITSFSRKLLIFGGKAPIYQGSKDYIEESEIKQGLALREAKIEEKKAGSNQLGKNIVLNGFNAPSINNSNNGFPSFSGFGK